MKAPKPITELNATSLRGLFFDLDDTFSTDGKITAEAYAAAWALHRAGKVLVLLTGRPAGWCDHMARMWPVDAVVGENGGFYCLMKDGRMAKRYAQSAAVREQERWRLDRIREEVLAAVPGTAVAADQPWREFDLAIDYAEDVPRLPAEAVQRIAGVFRRHGAQVRISSIHVNGWFGDYDKLTTARLYAANELGIDLEARNETFAFVGDSPNDEPLFAFFRNSVGVANVQEYAALLETRPAYVTRGRCGAGFVELAEHILRSG